MNRFMFEEDARRYFSRIEKTSRSGTFGSMLMQYWLCALAGLIAGEKEAVPHNATPVVDHFVRPLDGQQHLIRAFLFWRYAKDLGYGARKDEEEDLIKGLMQFFNQDSSINLSKGALDELDGYAAYGFRRICEHSADPPDLATFLVDYVSLLGRLEGEVAAIRPAAAVVATSAKPAVARRARAAKTAGEAPASVVRARTANDPKNKASAHKLQQLTLAESVEHPTP